MKSLLIVSFLFISVSVLFIQVCAQFLNKNFSDNQEDNDRKFSYEACIRLRTKFPNFNLKCETLLKDSATSEEEKKSRGDFDEDPDIRGVDEIKLRAIMMQKFSNQ